MGLVELPLSEMTETNGGCGKASNSHWRNFWNSHYCKKGYHHCSYQPPVCTPPPATEPPVTELPPELPL